MDQLLLVGPLLFLGPLLVLVPLWVPLLVPLGVLVILVDGGLMPHLLAFHVAIHKSGTSGDISIVLPLVFIVGDFGGAVGSPHGTSILAFSSLRVPLRHVVDHHVSNHSRVRHRGCGWQVEGGRHLFIEELLLLELRRREEVLGDHSGRLLVVTKLVFMGVGLMRGAQLTAVTRNSILIDFGKVGLFHLLR